MVAIKIENVKLWMAYFNWSTPIKYIKTVKRKTYYT